EKEPLLTDLGLETPLRAELAFALSRAGQPEQSIEEYKKCLQTEPDNFLYVSGLAYVFYNLVYSARNRERILPPQQKADYIDKAHRGFARAEQLRPEGVTNYYRQGMLYKNIQNMDLKAAPLFRQAIENWEAYDEQTREKRHQEFKNYVKSLYNLASCLLKQKKADQALNLLKKCLQFDEEKDFIKPEHKFFALGKIHFELGRFEEAQKDLEMAFSHLDPRNGDYILELWARVWLHQGKPMQGLQVLSRIPEKFRRQFVRWTEGDCYMAMQDFSKARQTWIKSMEKDRRSRHRALIRLARMEFKLNNYAECLKYASESSRFHFETYSNPDPEGLFWSAAACIRLAEKEKAQGYINDLKACKPDYPLLGRLVEVFRKTF
ncbi:MAG: tetratricopeptide repeat protein, partial [Desulfonatronovibrionaceae bacterium]